MKRFLIVLAALTISCGNTVRETKNEKSSTDQIEEAELQKDMLLGNFEKKDLQQKPFSNWFESGYTKFSPHTAAMETIEENIGNYEIKVFMGTWCGDSKREVPKLIKILDQADYNYDNLEMIAVDYDKKTPSGIEEEFNIQRVPTIIFYKDGKEVNRFVEYSQGESIEEDVAKIVSGKKYKDSYTD